MSTVAVIVLGALCVLGLVAFFVILVLFRAAADTREVRVDEDSM